MSIVDKMVAAVTPPEGEEARAEARSKARAAARAGDWLSKVLDHHLKLEAAFVAVKNASDVSGRVTAQKNLAVLLTGHVVAEETVLYPALALSSERGHADKGYSEQAMVKVQMAALEKLDPMSREYLDKLEHIRGAVAHHMYEEEGNWFLDLKEKLPADDQLRIAQRYSEEFERYVGPA